MRIWRISGYADLSGRGGTVGDGRWHWKGAPVVYCADHPSTSLLEILVHATRFTVPDPYQLIEIDVPEDVAVSDALVPLDWRENLYATRRIGTSFLKAASAAVLRVPSVVMPKACNLLINPLHAAASRITIVDTYSYPFDSRLVT